MDAPGKNFTHSMPLHLFLGEVFHEGGVVILCVSSVYRLYTAVALYFRRPCGCALVYVCVCAVVCVLFSSSFPEHSRVHVLFVFSWQGAGGKHKALLIGINYTGGKGELKGCHNDVKQMREYIVEHVSLVT